MKLFIGVVGYRDVDDDERFIYNQFTDKLNDIYEFIDDIMP